MSTKSREFSANQYKNRGRRCYIKFKWLSLPHVLENVITLVFFLKIGWLLNSLCLKGPEGKTSTLGLVVDSIFPLWLERSLQYVISSHGVRNAGTDDDVPNTNIRKNTYVLSGNICRSIKPTVIPKTVEITVNVVSSSWPVNIFFHVESGPRFPGVILIGAGWFGEPGWLLSTLKGVL